MKEDVLNNCLCQTHSPSRVLRFASLSHTCSATTWTVSAITPLGFPKSVVKKFAVSRRTLLEIRRHSLAAFINGQFTKATLSLVVGGIAQSV
jgi:hypothetical protein